MGQEKTARKIARSEDVGLVQHFPLLVHVEFNELQSSAHTSQDPRRDAQQESLFPTQGFGTCLRWKSRLRAHIERGSKRLGPCLRPQ